MRRFKQSLDRSACEEILRRGTCGVLAVCGDSGFPYAVPMSYVYEDSKVLFHCAKSGQKLEDMAQNDRVSFCVVDQDRIVPEEFTTYFRSVILSGRVRVLQDEAKRREALEKLALKYSPDLKAGCRAETERQLAHVCMVELAVEEMTGKEAMELVRARQGKDNSI